MAQIPEETKEQILAATDIVELIGSYIPVKRAGTRFVALCPFHNEKSPSFSINPQRQFFHCFGCKKSGDAITFVRELENLTYVDTLKKLASRVGIEVVEQAVDPRESAERKRRGRLLDLHREVSRFFHGLLMRSEAAAHARDYLKSRGFGSEMAKRWEIGWAPEPTRIFLDWAREKGLRGRDLVDAGIAVQRETGGIYLRFRDRLMFPIRNDHGDVIAFSGRQLREDPRSGKYINSPETPLFQKSRVLFALDRARKPILDARSALICEGQMDAVACHEQGIGHAIAGLGTAFTPQHARTLKRYTKQAVLCYDSDKAGYSGAERAFRELAGEGVSVRAVAMPAGEDPDSFMQKHGAEAFRALVEAAPSFFDFAIDRARADGRLEDPQQRAEFAREMAPLLGAVSDAVSRDALINHVATRLQAGAPELREAIARSQRGSPRRFERRHDDTPEPEKPAEPTVVDSPLGYLCSLALASKEAQEWLGEQWETLHEVAPQLRGVALLEQVLAARPDPANPAAVNRFLGDLAEADRLALVQQPSFSEPPPEDPLAAAGDALAEASSLALEKRDHAVKAALADPALSAEQRDALLREAMEIATLLAALPNRALRNDRYAPNSRPRRSREGHEGRGPRSSTTP